MVNNFIPIVPISNDVKGGRGRSVITAAILPGTEFTFFLLQRYTPIVVVNAIILGRTYLKCIGACKATCREKKANQNKTRCSKNPIHKKTFVVSRTKNNPPTV